MNKKSFYSFRLYFTGAITIVTWIILLWAHSHGGVASHHLLNREDLPAISNWWGGLILPLLSWFLLYRVHRRIFQTTLEEPPLDKFPGTVVYGFVTALFYGASIALLFIYNYESIPGYMLLALLAIALFYPIYRAECILGFVMGMTIAFGVILPILVAAVFSLIGLLIYRLLRPGALYILSTLFTKSVQKKG